jgi:hypothetical protein
MESGEEANARRHLERSRDDGAILRWAEASDLRARLETLDRRRTARESAAATRAVPVPPTPTPIPSPPPPPTAAASAAPTTEPASPPGTPAEVARGSATATPVSPGGPQSRTPPPEAAAVPGSRHLVEAVVGAFSAGDFERAQAALDELRRNEPAAIEADLLEAVLLGSRYLLDGRRDEAQLGRARRALQSFRRRGGSRKAEALWISPALAAALGRG